MNLGKTVCVSVFSACDECTEKRVEREVGEEKAVTSGQDVARVG